ncbi:hypothetical protein LJC74_00660 [Eubacteriales bacterium OttesenSCG-928-A19]|nr:hypothetical protein [Eubacteriales bacterium OttesenSCG-928-A19]
MTELWARAIRRHRIARSETVPMENDDLVDALGLLCAKLDIPRPMMLGKHEREWEQFGLTSFARDDFIEKIPYDRLEVERIDPDAKKKRSEDPRNG